MAKQDKRLDGHPVEGEEDGAKAKIK